MTWHGKGAGSSRQKMLWSRVRYVLLGCAVLKVTICASLTFICAHSIDFHVTNCVSSSTLLTVCIVCSSMLTCILAECVCR